MGLRRSATAALGLVGLALLAPPAWPQPPVREITRVAGQAYRFQNGGHYSIFAVTSAGIIATDPINAGAAHWLKEEMARRFNQPRGEMLRYAGRSRR